MRIRPVVASPVFAILDREDYFARIFTTGLTIVGAGTDIQDFRQKYEASSFIDCLGAYVMGTYESNILGIWIYETGIAHVCYGAEWSFFAANYQHKSRH